MLLPEIRSRAPRGLLYGVLVGLLATVTATGARALLDPVLQDHAPFLTYFLAVVLAAWLGGGVAGVLSLVGGTVAADYFFVEPRHTLFFDSAENRIGALAFVVLASALMVIVFRWRRTETALLRAQAVLAQAGEMTHLGAWAVEYSNLADLYDNPLYWSAETYRIFGYQPGQVAVDHRLFFDHVHPEDRQRLADAVAEAMARKTPYTCEHRIVRADGSERLVLEHGDIEFDVAGRPRRMIGAVRDVTEQRRIERDVREASERLRRVVEHIHDALIMDDVEGRVVFANDRFLRLFGFERSDLDRIRLEDYVAPEYRQQLRERHTRRLRGEEVPAHYEYEGIARDGRRMWIEVAVAPVFDEFGTMIGTQSALRDATDRKRADEALRASEETARRRADELERLMAERQQLAEELRRKADELAEANRLKDEFIATVSHELRTPLNAMLGWADLLRERRLAGDAEERALQVIANNARRQAQLIEDLLDMSRIVAGKLRLEARVIDPVPPVEAAIEAVQPSAVAKGIALRGPAGSQRLLVLADASRLQQVVWNLLTNAVKFTPKGGEIAVDVTASAQEVEIAVRDTGSGIPAHFLPHVFDRFRQADSRTTRTHSGLGIGLSIVRHLVEAQGGQVRAESGGENQGAAFFVTLPRQVLDERRAMGGTGAHEAASQGATPALGAALCGIRVLTVDDEADARELTAVVLRHHGAEVTVAESAAAALVAVRHQAPHVLVIDIAMPEIDGYGLLKQIRELGGKYRGIPAIALTAYAREEDRRQALANGFHVHLAKPLDEETLVRAIAGIV